MLQGTPSAIVDPDYSARLEASGETLSLGDGKTTPTGKSPVKAAPAAKATAAAKGPPAATAPPATESAPAAKGAPASRGVPASEGTQRGIKRERAPAGIKRERVPGPAQPASAPAKVYHWPVKRPRLGDEATSRGNSDSRPASAAGDCQCMSASFRLLYLGASWGAHFPAVCCCWNYIVLELLQSLAEPTR